MISIIDVSPVSFKSRIWNLIKWRIIMYIFISIIFLKINVIASCIIGFIFTATLYFSAHRACRYYITSIWIENEKKIIHINYFDYGNPMNISFGISKPFHYYIRKENYNLGLILIKCMTFEFNKIKIMQMAIPNWTDEEIDQVYIKIKQILE